MYPSERNAQAAAGSVLVQHLTVPRHVEDVSFEAPRGEITCIAGQIGSGANAVTRALAGLLPEARAEVRIDGRPLPLGSVSQCVARNVLFLSEDRAGEGLFQQLRVRDNLIASSLATNSRCGIVRWGALQRLASRLSERVGINAARMRSLAGHLSGGNQQKVLFGRAVREGEPGVLLMNEPTRGVDVGARADIYRLMRTLCDQGYALIIASSDLEEAVGIADRMVTMYRGRVVAHYTRSEIDMARILADIIHPAHPEQAAA
jgi:ABC-type sugar transport system ATPase subunit